MKRIILTILIVFFLFPLSAQAICEGPILTCGLSQDYGNTPAIDESGPCTLCHLFALLDNILRLILTCLAPIVGLVMIGLGGFLLLVSGTNVSMADHAKRIIMATFLGIVIIAFSWISLNILFVFIGTAEWIGFQGGGFEIVCEIPEPPPEDDDSGDDGGGFPSVYCDICMRTASADGSCSVDVETGWGELGANPGYDCPNCTCAGEDQRCYQGTCVTCGGFLYSDGCNGCAGQGGKACWYQGSGSHSCVPKCEDHEFAGITASCVKANWNDRQTCDVCIHFYPGENCRGGPGGNEHFLPGYYYWTIDGTLHHETCYYRKGTSQVCTGSWDKVRRFCVCTF